ncbi:Hypothetical protein, putative [Bodo saltans]|uniref:Uncharacterized protein n=1 Tax=Bodo saltans TaxID=75058 RepID=A0A0S4IRL4_BODSA|nr:Hypothetical protein, putative [Bodo saltans]|eukprot:CUF37774.1 Hypothetical protein, putative [Bodo saltans]
MMASSNGERPIVYMIGPESVGKSTLVLQLQSLIALRGLIRLQEELVVSPTTGQEMCTLQIPSATTMRSWIRSSTAQTTKDAPSAAGSGAQFQSVVAPNDALERTADSTVLIFSPNRQSSPLQPSPPPPTEVSVSVRELGGRMASSWSKFISTAAAKHPVRGVMFVINIAANFQIPLASGEFVSLVSEMTTPLSGSNGGGSGARVLLLINRCGFPDFSRQTIPPGSQQARYASDAVATAPRRMTERDVVEAFIRPLDRSVAARVDVMWIDTWLGIGLLDVLMWLRRTAE